MCRYGSHHSSRSRDPSLSPPLHITLGHWITAATVRTEGRRILEMKWRGKMRNWRDASRHSWDCRAHGSRPISFFSFLPPEEYYSNGTHQGAAMWLFYFSMENHPELPLAHMHVYIVQALWLRSLIWHHTVKVIAHLQAACATDAPISEITLDIMNFQNSVNQSSVEYLQVLYAKANQILQAYFLRVQSPETLIARKAQSIRQSARSHMIKNKFA